MGEHMRVFFRGYSEDTRSLDRCFRPKWRVVRGSRFPVPSCDGVPHRAVYRLQTTALQKGR